MYYNMLSSIINLQRVIVNSFDIGYLNKQDAT